MKYDKIAVIGQIDSVLVFKALGIEVFGAQTGENAKHLLKKLSKLGYAVIYITEDLAANLKETIEKFKTQAYPAIIPIPTAKGASGFGMKGLMEDADKAIGADILFKQ